MHQSSTGDLAIRQGPWKQVFLKTGTNELYNLQEDRAETNDLSAANPEIVVRMTKLMQAYIDKGRSTPGVPQKNDVKVDLSQPGAKRRAQE